jgi:hypothetical protein
VDFHPRRDRRIVHRVDDPEHGRVLGLGCDVPRWRRDGVVRRGLVERAVKTPGDSKTAAVAGRALSQPAGRVPGTADSRSLGFSSLQ